MFLTLNKKNGSRKERLGKKILIDIVFVDKKDFKYWLILAVLLIFIKWLIRIFNDFTYQRSQELFSLWFVSYFIKAKIIKTRTF